MTRKPRRSGRPVVIYTSEKPASDLDKSPGTNWFKKFLSKPVISIGGVKAGSREAGAGETDADTSVVRDLRPANSPRNNQRRSPKASRPKPSREAPPGAHIPTMGVPRLVYGINQHVLGRPDRVPKLNKTEQRMLRNKNSKQELSDLSDRVPNLTVAYFGVKGLAATTATTVHTASVLAEETRSMVAVSDFNPAQGSAAGRLGRDFDQTITLRGLLRELNQIETTGEFIGRLRPTPYGVRVVSADSIVSGHQHLNGDDARRMLEAIRANFEYHHIDTGNDVTTDVSLAVAEAAQVFVFTANSAVRDSLRLLGIGMETLREHGFQEKVDHSVVVISNLPSRGMLENYRKYLNYVDIQHTVIREIPFYGDFLGVPHDPLIALDGQVDLGSLKGETYQSYIDLNNAILKMASQLRHETV